MKHTLKKILNISLSIFSTISHAILIWIFFSTVEVAFTDTKNKKINDYNIFALSNTIRSNNNYDIHKTIYTDEIIEDDSEDEIKEFKL